jgi:hypothetical protein
VSNQLIVLAGAIALLAACSDTTGPNVSAAPGSVTAAPLPSGRPLPTTDECSLARKVIASKELARTVISSTSDVPQCPIGSVK